jgi:hypothetical protein
MRTMWSTAIVTVAVSVAASAQSGKDMAKPMDGDMTHMMYTGCVESVNHGGTFLLTHVAADHQMVMGHDGMKSDSSMEKKGESAASSDMHMDHMMPSSLVMTGSSELKKHVGQKVTISGSVSKGTMEGGTKNELDSLTVGSLKVIGKACE